MTHPKRTGFTLVEMLTVMAVIVVLIALVAPAMNAINGAGSFTNAISTISGTLEQARVYAMANNTYVYVGLLEVNDSTSTSSTLQRGTDGGIGGRVIVAVVASKNGLSGYDVSNPQDSWKSNYQNAGAYKNGANLTVIGKPATFENVHLADIMAAPVAAGSTPDPSNKMLRPQTNPPYQLGEITCKSLTPFTYPPGSPIDSGYQYLFEKVIGFDPQGTTRVITQTSDADSTPLQIEIGLLPTHGAASPTPPTDSKGQQAAIQVDGITSAVHIYRP